jgi:GntR family transcriptional regulator, transcriptional repressor for pyruvate dehydrogenase complex
MSRVTPAASPAQSAGNGDGTSLVRATMDAVTGHIREQGLRVGDSLPGEGHFADTLGVSRAVIREAFGALAALKLIDVGNGRKPRVGAIDGSVIATAVEHGISTAQISVSDVWDVRRTIEQRTAALAATKRTDEEARRILELVDAMARDCDDLDVMSRHDIDFHSAIARASHNELFVQIVASFGPLMQVAVPVAWRTRRTERQKKTTINRHRAVARAIHERDAEGAAAAMNAHFDSSIDDLLKAGPINEVPVLGHGVDSPGKRR